MTPLICAMVGSFLATKPPSPTEVPCPALALKASALCNPASWPPPLAQVPLFHVAETVGGGTLDDFLLGAAASAQQDHAASISPPASCSAIRASLKKDVQGGKLPSIALEVVRNGQIIWDEAFGWADRERKIKATGDTIYPIASVSKALTATGAYVLVERGLLKTDHSIEDYLGPVHLRNRDAGTRMPTLSEVLCMKGGIPHYVKYCWEDEPAPLLDTPTILERYAAISFPPGDYFHYSNLAYGVVEQAVAQVSHSSFEEVMRRELFGPLGMDRTFLRVPAGLRDERAAPYNDENKRDRDYYFYPRGGAGFYSTVHDLMRFAMLHLQQPTSKSKAILKPETISDLHIPSAAETASAGYANGWGVIDLGAGEKALVSNGELLGAAATIVLLPANKCAIVCMTNINGRPRISDSVAFRIADALSPGFAKKLDAAESAFNQRDQARETLTSLSGRWEGHIRSYNVAHRLALIVNDKGTATVSLDGREEVRLKNAQFNGKALLGSFPGTIETTEPGTSNPRIEIELLREAEVLEGVAHGVRPGASPGMVECYVQLARK